MRLIGKLWAERKPLTTYDCADHTQREGGIWHGHGVRVPLDPLATHKSSWEHTLQNTGTNAPHTIYGPYVNDFGRPAYYRVIIASASMVLALGAPKILLSSSTSYRGRSSWAKTSSFLDSG